MKDWDLKEKLQSSSNKKPMLVVHGNKIGINST